MTQVPPNGTVYGRITFAHMAGGAAAAAMAGEIHDVAGDYAIPIYLAGVLGVARAGDGLQHRWAHAQSGVDAGAPAGLSGAGAR
ncbi:MAG: hypothetical protein ACR2HN_12740 [Tepidiformaceae bacterium]